VTTFEATRRSRRWLSSEDENQPTHPWDASTMYRVDLRMASDKKIFAIMATSQPDKLEALIESQFPENNFLVASGQWLVVGPSTMTSQELAVKLQVSVDESVSAAIIMSVSGYFGRAPINVWEWLVAKSGDTSAVAG